MEALSYCQLMERCLAAEARVVELAAENVGLLKANKVALNTLNDEETMVTSLWASSVQNVSVETPATNAAIAAQRSAFVDEAVAKITESGALTFGDCIVALCQLRECTK